MAENLKLKNTLQVDGTEYDINAVYSDEAGKVSIRHGSHTAAGEICPQVLHDPAADDAVVRQDQHGHQAGQGSDPAHLGMDMGVGRQGALAGLTADGDLGNQQGEAESQGQDQVAQQEDAAAILGGQVGETPDVTQTHRAAGCRQHKTQGTGEAAPGSLLFHIYSSKSKKRVYRIMT